MHAKRARKAKHEGASLGQALIYGDGEQQAFASLTTKGWLQASDVDPLVDAQCDGSSYIFHSRMAFLRARIKRKDTFSLRLRLYFC